MDARSVISVLTDDLLELLFPTRCLGCDRRGQWFCSQCHNQSILTRSLSHCQLCNRLVNQPGALCRLDQARLGLTGLTSYGDYHAQPLRRAIGLIKYRGVFAGIKDLVTAGQSRYQPMLTAHRWQAIVPIPLSQARLQERNFNQADLIARALKESRISPRVHLTIKVPRDQINRGLVRTRETEHQTLLGRAERRTNVANAFVWHGDRLRGDVLIVDDVLTTGATLAEAAQVLRQAGARHVWALTVAYET